MLPDPALVDMLVEGRKLLEDIKTVVVVTPDDLYPKREARWNAVRTVPTMAFTDLDRASTFLEVDQSTVRVMVDEAREVLRGARPA